MPLLPPTWFAAATTWAADRHALWRLPVLLWFAWTASGHLRDPLTGSILSGLYFGAHEFGHLAFAFFGELMTILGGSLMQLLVPIGAAAAMAHARDWFGVACALCLLGGSCGDLALYIGDARALELDLVSFSPDGGDHDWRWLLDRWGLLRQDQAIARAVRGVGALCIGVGTLGGGWLLTQMRWRLSAPPAPPE
jgi:hypothetical protein